MRPSEDRSTARRFASSYAAAAHRMAAEAGPAGISLKALRGLTVDVIALRRGDRGAARLKLEQERLRLKQGRSERRTGAGLRTGLGLRWSARRSSARASACHRIRGQRLRLRARSRASLQERLRRLVLRPQNRSDDAGIQPNQAKSRLLAGLGQAVAPLENGPRMPCFDWQEPLAPWFRRQMGCFAVPPRTLAIAAVPGRGKECLPPLLIWGKAVEISTRPKFLTSLP